MSIPSSWRKSGNNGRPFIMGILNVTPDSFSDGDMYCTKESAVKHVLELIDQGADIIDIGGESTRPGSDPVPVEDELLRVIPVLKELVPLINVPISVDTMKSQVAEAALSVGASIINDIRGLTDSSMLALAVSSDVPVVIMHMHGTPKTLGTDLMEGSVLRPIKRFLDDRITAALDAGMKEKNIILDPGVGFGTTPDQNMDIIKNCSFFSDKYPILIGASRKRFLSVKFPGMERDEASAEAAKIAVKSGADIVRVHNVAITKKMF